MNDEYIKEKRYKLAHGTQVREEDFGLLFYTMAGPRLYFLSSGDLIDCNFFEEGWTLEEWIKQHGCQDATERTKLSGLSKGLRRLSEKGVIHEY